jgi:tetratricopeptide (TPR) repeat protein
MADRSGGDRRRGNRGNARQGGRQGDRRGNRQSGRPDRQPSARQRDTGQPAAPPIPDDIQATDLDPDVRRDLVSLPKELADRVARHLVAAGVLLEDDPERALQHARFARSKAPRIAAVREAAGLAAYRAGEWAEALAELRAARRISGGPGHLPVLADVERALGRPERALELARSPEARDLDEADRIELLIVSAGARRDLGELDAAVVSLQVPELDPRRSDPWSARLFYAHADNLLASGRREDAIRWFLAAADADLDEQTDAAERLEELTTERAAP